jgi:hypothetical protein
MEPIIIGVSFKIGRIRIDPAASIAIAQLVINRNKAKW